MAGRPSMLERWRLVPNIGERVSLGLAVLALACAFGALLSPAWLRIEPLSTTTVALAGARPVAPKRALLDPTPPLDIVFGGSSMDGAPYATSSLGLFVSKQGQGVVNVVTTRDYLEYTATTVATYNTQNPSRTIPTYQASQISAIQGVFLCALLFDVVVVLKLLLFLAACGTATVDRYLPWTKFVAALSVVFKVAALGTFGNGDFQTALCTLSRASSGSGTLVNCGLGTGVALAVLSLFLSFATAVLLHRTSRDGGFQRRWTWTLPGQTPTASHGAPAHSSFVAGDGAGFADGFGVAASSSTSATISQFLHRLGIFTALLVGAAVLLGAALGSAHWMDVSVQSSSIFAQNHTLSFGPFVGVSVPSPPPPTPTPIIPVTPTPTPLAPTIVYDAVEVVAGLNNLPNLVNDANLPAAPAPADPTVLFYVRILLVAGVAFAALAILLLLGEVVFFAGSLATLLRRSDVLIGVLATAWLASSGTVLQTPLIGFVAAFLTTLALLALLETEQRAHVVEVAPWLSGLAFTATLLALLLAGAGRVFDGTSQAADFYNSHGTPTSSFNVSYGSGFILALVALFLFFFTSILLSRHIHSAPFPTRAFHTNPDAHASLLGEPTEAAPYQHGAFASGVAATTPPATTAAGYQVSYGAVPGAEYAPPPTYSAIPSTTTVPPPTTYGAVPGMTNFGPTRVG